MKYQFPIIIVLIILILAIFIYKRRSGKKSKGKEKARGGRGNKRGGRSRGRGGRGRSSENNSNRDDEDDDEEEEPDLVEDARELFGLVHDDLAQGMQLDEFEDLAGDLAGENPEEVYIELKQLYNSAMDDNKDPSKSVSLDDYIEVLENSD